MPRLVLWALAGRETTEGAETPRTEAAKHGLRVPAVKSNVARFEMRSKTAIDPTDAVIVHLHSVPASGLDLDVAAADPDFQAKGGVVPLHDKNVPLRPFQRQQRHRHQRQHGAERDEAA